VTTALGKLLVQQAKYINEATGLFAQGDNTERDLI